jgi:transcription initiation factor IIE alpha subunit
MSQKPVYGLNVREISGAFPCPDCGEMMDPSDGTEKVYKVLKLTLDKNEALKAMTLGCLKCNRKIELRWQ